MPAAMHQELIAQHQDALAVAQQKREHGESFNEIIVKVEMRKFQNLINNRLQKRNNLVSADINRVFPINKLANGTAQPAQAPTSFRDGLMKFNPNLFSVYEKINNKSKSKDGPGRQDPRQSVYTYQ